MRTLPFAVIPHALGDITTGNALAARPASHLGELDSIGMTWRSSGTTSLWVRGDFGSAKPIDFAAVLLANALPGTTIRLRLGASQAAVDGTAAYDSGALTFISPAITRDDGLYTSHLELPSVQTYRWWRIDIGGHTGDFEASALILGKRVTPTTWPSAGHEYDVDDLGDIEISRYGIPEETPGRIMRKLRFQLGWLSEADYETKFRSLVETLGKRRVVYWCFDPTANVYRQNRTYFGWLRPPPAAKHVVTTPDGPRFSKDFEILSMV